MPLVPAGFLGHHSDLTCGEGFSLGYSTSDCCHNKSSADTQMTLLSVGVCNCLLLLCSSSWKPRQRWTLGRIPEGHYSLKTMLVLERTTEEAFSWHCLWILKRVFWPKEGLDRVTILISLMVTVEKRTRRTKGTEPCSSRAQLRASQLKGTQMSIVKCASHSGWPLGGCGSATSCWTAFTSTFGDWPHRAKGVASVDFWTPKPVWWVP